MSPLRNCKVTLRLISREGSDPVEIYEAIIDASEPERAEKQSDELVADTISVEQLETKVVDEVATALDQQDRSVKQAQAKKGQTEGEHYVPLPEIAEKIVKERKAFRESLKDAARCFGKAAVHNVVRVFVDWAKDRVTKG